MESCSVGKELKDECHKLTYTRMQQIVDFTTIEDDEKILLKWRSGLKHLDKLETVCMHHWKYFIGNAFERKFTRCCDLFKTHKQKVKANHRITLDLARKLENNSIEVVPGWKLCAVCYQKSKELEVGGGSNENSSCSSSTNSDKESERRLGAKRCLESALDACEVSPVITHSVPKKQRKIQAKQKIHKVVQRLEDAFNISIGEESSYQNENTEVSKDELNQLKKDSSDLLDLMYEVKEKLSFAKSYKEKQQLLTMKPKSWTVKKAAAFFEVSEYLVRESLNLKSNYGILAKPTYKSRNELPQSTIEAVTAFYENDEYSRLMPGKKDCVSVARNLHKQKRLLLCNLKELYFAFQEKHPDIKIGFSKFCYLCPKWCVNASNSGTHSVCVCTQHQNTILLCNAAHLNQSYKDLMSMVVCSTKNKMCMVHRCASCPGKEMLRQFLTEQLISAEAEDIVYTQWQSTDRSTLKTLVSSASSFVDLLTEAVDKLTAHSYIAKCQARYLSERKQTMDFESCVALLDFAENYQFVVQDEVQSFHWNQSQCSIHPVVLYYKNNENLLTQKSICFISNDLCHDTAFVYKIFQSLAIYINQKLGDRIKKIEYFSDGCSAQYKNYKNLLNLCYHKSDFGLDCSWSFFATSHGKSPCDGIGGTVKRLATRASLQRPYTDQILDSDKLVSFCKEHVNGIKFFEIQKDELQIVRQDLNERYKQGSTVHGTRSFHHFEPQSLNVIAFKRVSDDEQFTGFHKFFERTAPIACKVADYVACTYDSNWWIGMVCDIFLEDGDVNIKFMAPHGPNPYFYWPRDDVCCVPANHILCVISPPTPTTVSGRKYRIENHDLQKILSTFEKLHTENGQ